MIEIDGVNYPTVDEWATALESGEYQQTTSVLHNNQGYCCIGVNAELAGLPSRSAGTGAGEIQYQYPFDTRENELNCMIIDMKGWSTTSPSSLFMSKYGLSPAGSPLELTDDGYQEWNLRHEQSLMAMNDHGRSFPYIGKKLREWKQKGWIHDPR